MEALVVPLSPQAQLLPRATKVTTSHPRHMEATAGGIRAVNMSIVVQSREGMELHPSLMVPDLNTEEESISFLISSLSPCSVVQFKSNVLYCSRSLSITIAIEFKSSLLKITTRCVVLVEFTKTWNCNPVSLFEIYGILKLVCFSTH